MREAWLRLPANVRGALWITVGTAIFALNDAVVKFLGTTFHPTQMGFFRYFIGMVLLAPVFMRLGWNVVVKTDRLGLHVVRTIVAALSQVGIYYAVIHMMLVDVTAISFSRALFMTLLAVLILSETVGWRRWTATAVGFLGVLVMVRPGPATFDPVAVVALAAALGFAFALVIIRMMAPTEPQMRIMFYYQLGGMILLLGPTVALWQTPLLHEWALLILIGALTTVAMVCFVRGFHIGETSILGPMEYTRLVWAALLGYLLFAEVPSLWTWAGAAIIVASTLYIAQRAARRAAPSGG